MNRITEYYEAILQVRADVPAEAVERIISNVKKKREFNCWIHKGDYYFSNVKAAKDVSQRLSKEFKLKVNESRKQVGYDRAAGKRRYKWTICLRSRTPRTA